MKAIVTCGPSIEPIDNVRRITNFATGELGVLLSNALAKSGAKTICIKSATATTHLEFESSVECRPFDTNHDLVSILEGIAASTEPPTAIFHTAALCDFRVAEIVDACGQQLAEAKIPTTNKQVRLVLEPTVKVIGRLRPLFPKAVIVGWKYELSGTLETSIGKARHQILRNQTDACVLNGTAYGKGFGFVDKIGSPLRHLESKPSLCGFLCDWLQSRIK